MLVEIVNGADVESGIVFASDRVGSLVEKLTADGELLGDLFLQQPADEPVILVERAAAVVDPIAAAPVSGPIAEAFLQPHRQIYAHVTGAETAALVSGRQFDEGEDADHRTQPLIVLLDETVLEAKFGVAIAELRWPRGGTVECERCDDVELSVGNEAV